MTDMKLKTGKNWQAVCVEAVQCVGGLFQI